MSPPVNKGPLCFDKGAISKATEMNWVQAVIKCAGIDCAVTENVQLINVALSHDVVCALRKPSVSLCK